MSNHTEDQLRAVLRDRAQSISATGDPVVLVEVRMRRRFRRRSAGVAGAAAVGVTAVAVGVNAFGASRTPTQPVGPAVVASQLSPTPSASASPTPSRTQTPPTPSPTASDSGGAPGVAAPNVSSVQLPAGYWFDYLATGSGGLHVIGTVQSTDSGASCVSAPVGTQPLAVGKITEGRCPDPAAFGEAVTAWSSDTVVAGQDTATIAIARTDPVTGVTTTGPPVMTYSPASDTQPVIAYGGDSMWIYDVDTTDGPEAMAVSATTGTVQAVVRTPKLYTPVIAADNNGLWLGNSIRGTDAGATLFHIAPGSHTVSTVVSGSGNAVDWLRADQGHVWAGIRPSGNGLEETMWRFDGVNATVAFHLVEPLLPAATSTVVGSESDGLWSAVPYPAFGATLSPDANKELDVLRIDPDTGQAVVEAKLPALPQLAAQTGASPGSIDFFDGACFVLEPPFQQGGYTGYTSLARIAPLK